MQISYSDIIAEELRKHAELDFKNGHNDPDPFASVNHKHDYPDPIPLDQTADSLSSDACKLSREISYHCNEEKPQDIDYYVTDGPHYQYLSRDKEFIRNIDDYCRFLIEYYNLYNITISCINHVDYYKQPAYTLHWLDASVPSEGNYDDGRCKEWKDSTAKKLDSVLETVEPILDACREAMYDVIHRLYGDMGYPGLMNNSDMASSMVSASSEPLEEDTISPDSEQIGSLYDRLENLKNSI